MPSSAQRLSRQELGPLGASLRRQGRKVVWTNGCFDLLHAGHVAALEQAKREGNVLVVGVNSDRSVRALKGPERPFVGEDARAALVAALGTVDYVVVFDGERCTEELRALAPDVWVKSGDYGPESLDPDECRAVQEGGGRIVIAPFVAGMSTTQLVQDVRRGDPEKLLSAAFGFLRDGEGRLLLVKTRYNDGERWGLPGGAQNRYESLPQTVVRETEEEARLPVRAVRLLGVLERIAPARNRHLVSHLFELEYDDAGGPWPDPEPNPAEHVVAVDWFDDARLADEPAPILGRVQWRRYLADPAAWPPHVLLGDADE